MEDHIHIKLLRTRAIVLDRDKIMLLIIKYICSSFDQIVSFQQKSLYLVERERES